MLYNFFLFLQYNFPFTRVIKLFFSKNSYNKIFFSIPNYSQIIVTLEKNNHKSFMSKIISRKHPQFSLRPLISPGASYFLRNSSQRRSDIKNKKKRVRIVFCSRDFCRPQKPQAGQDNKKKEERERKGSRGRATPWRSHDF